VASPCRPSTLTSSSLGRSPTFATPLEHRPWKMTQATGPRGMTRRCLAGRRQPRERSAREEPPQSPPPHVAIQVRLYLRPPRRGSALSSGAASASGVSHLDRTSPTSFASRCYTGTMASTKTSSSSCRSPTSATPLERRPWAMPRATRGD
jgi:hypothetical protein